MRLIQNGFANNFGLVGKNLRRYLTTTALTATSLAAFVSPALADNWTDHVASEGSISIDTSVVNTTNITQHTDFTKVSGDGDINAGWTVNLAQPSSSSKYVLYDIENDPTEIMGALNANGQVYIFDQNGVIFGGNSQVNVGSIVASTGAISDANIKADKLVFENVGGAGSIAINGTISVADSGLAAFVAPGVKNSGVINAKMGTVALASGNTVTLDLYGDNLVEIAVDGALENALVENSGQINASGGRVVLAAQAAKNAVDSVINMDGIIDVSSVSSKGGKIVLSGGNKGVVNVSGKLNADGETGGGSIEVTAQNVSVVATGELTADAGAHGNGGSILAYGNDFAIFSGRVSARGGSESGNGGDAEISGGESVGYYGFTDLSAANGDVGTLLIDPRFLTITNINSAAADIALLLADYVSGGTSSLINIYDKALAKTLYYANVNLWATESITTLTNVDVSTANVQTSTQPFSISKGCFNPFGCAVFSDRITGNDLILSAPTVNILHDITLGTGGLKIYDIAAGVQPAGWNGITNTILPSPFAIAVDTVNLNGLIKSRSTVGGAVTIADPSKLDGQAHQVNVLSDNASINQAIRFADGTLPGLATVRVLPGHFNESVLVNKTIKLLGTWAGVNPLLRLIVPAELETVIDPNSPGIHVTADNAVVDGFVVTGATGSDGYGVWVDGANNVTVSNNIIHGNESHGVYINNDATNTTVNSNRIYDLGTAVDTANGIFADGFSNGLEITGNFIDDIKGNGIYVRGTSGLINIKTNFIGQGATDAGVDGIWGDGIQIHDVNGNTFIQSNVISNTWDPTKNNTNDNSSGIYLLRSSNIVVGGDGLLDGNLITNVDWDGVKMAGGTGNLVQGNIINDVTRIGIYGEGTNNATILLNSVTNANLDEAGAITLRDGDDHTISYNFVSGPTSGADAGIMLHVGAGGNNVISHNIVHDINGVGIEVFNVSDADIMYNSVSKTKGDAIYLYDSYGDFNLIGNIIDDVKGNGIYVRLVGGLINVKANLIGLLSSDAGVDGIWGDGIEIHDVNGNTFVQSNVISNTWDPTKDNTNDNSSGIYLKRSSNIVVGGPDLLDGNLITNADWDGVKMAGGTGNLVQGNIIHSSTRIGIYGEGTSNASVLNNLVHDSNLETWGGITLLDGDDHTVNDNVVWNKDTSTGWHGIYLERNGGDNEVSDNWVYNVSHNGIHVQETEGSFEIDNNKIGDVENGIWARDVEALKITDNLIDARVLTSGKGGFGIYVQDSDYAQIGGGLLSDSNYVEDFDTGIRVVNSDVASVLGNIVNAFVDYGINVSGSEYSSINSNVVGNGDGTGIRLFDSGFSDINNNIVTLVGGHGIELVDSSEVQIDGNIISLVGQHGIYVDPFNFSDFVEVSNNWIHLAKWDGVNFQAGAFGKIFSNHIGFVGGDGIDVVGAPFVKIYDNFIHNTGDSGIEVDDSNYAEIKKNRIFVTGGNGIEVKNTLNAEVKKNKIEKSGKNGIFSDGVENILISHNKIEKSGWDGIHVANFFSAGIFDNNVDRSGDDGIEAHDGHIVEIDGNEISKSGWGWYGAHSEYDEFFGGHDGISVRNINGAEIFVEDEGDYDDEVSALVYDGYYSYQPGIVRITNNGVGAGDGEIGEGEEMFAKSFYGTDGGVSRSVDDGIEVVNVEGYVYIVGNSVEHSGVGPWGLPYDGVSEYGADGIHVRDAYLSNYGYTDYNHYRDGDIGNGEYNVVVSNNDVNNSLDDGIEILGTGEYGYEIMSSKIYGGEYGEGEYGEGDHDHGTYGENEGLYKTSGDTGRVLVSGNTVNNSGWGAPSQGYGESWNYYSGGDGIHVEGVYAYSGYGEGASEGNIFSGYAVDILGNTVNNSGDDGINVEYSSSTLIDQNTVTNSGWVGEGYGEEEGDFETAKIFEGYEETGADKPGADGIYVNNVGGGFYGIPSPKILEVEGPGDGYQQYSVVIRRNNVDNSLDDGIHVANYMGGYGESEGEYSIYDYYGYTAPVLIGGNFEGDGNTVTDSGFHGLFISGGGHNNVIVSGNAFANFDTGAQFESGLIDLTGASNTFDNGRIGLRFSPYLLGYEYGDDEGEGFSGIPYFANLNLVDNDGPGSTPYPTTPTNFGGTIGAQIFNGFTEEGDFYVYLDDYALTNEGTPIWLNGLNSSYDGITPSDTGGALTQEQFDFLEARFRHFPDAGAETADIFWFGFVPDLIDINQSLIFNQFGAFNGDITGLNVRITGLPNLGGQGPQNFNNIQTFAGNQNDPASLNQIETAAGGDEQQDPQNLAEIETEAGGENQNCWSDAANVAGGGQTVNVVYGGSMDDNLSQAAACGTAF